MQGRLQLLTCTLYGLETLSSLPISSVPSSDGLIASTSCGASVVLDALAFARKNNLGRFPNEFESIDIPRRNELISLPWCAVDPVIVVVRLRVDAGVIVRERSYCERAPEGERLRGVWGGSWRVSTDALAIDEVCSDDMEVEGASETLDLDAPCMYHFASFSGTRGGFEPAANLPNTEKRDLAWVSIAELFIPFRSVK